MVIAVHTVKAATDEHEPNREHDAMNARRDRDASTCFFEKCSDGIRERRLTS